MIVCSLLVECLLRTTTFIRWSGTDTISTPEITLLSSLIKKSDQWWFWICLWIELVLTNLSCNTPVILLISPSGEELEWVAVFTAAFTAVHLLAGTSWDWVVSVSPRRSPRWLHLGTCPSWAFTLLSRLFGLLDILLFLLSTPPTDSLPELWVLFRLLSSLSQPVSMENCKLAEDVSGLVELGELGRRIIGGLSAEFPNRASSDTVSTVSSVSLEPCRLLQLQFNLLNWDLKGILYCRRQARQLLYFLFIKSVEG